MPPRRRPPSALAGVALATLLVLSGCVAGSGPAADPSAGTTPPAGATPTTASCSLPETGTVTTVSPTPTPSGTGQLSGGVEIRNYYDGTLSVVLVDARTDTPVLARRYPPNRTAIRLGGEMVDWRDYEVTIRAGCEVVWDRPVYSYEEYSLSVLENGTVTVDSVAQA